MEHLKRGQTWQITGSITHKKRTESKTKPKLKPNLFAKRP
jgi:hypothetical protein